MEPAKVVRRPAHRRERASRVPAPCRRLLCGVIVAALMTAPLAIRADAQTAAVSKLKAAFLYNFAKFASWPADALASGQRLHLCVVGDDGVVSALEETIKGRTVEGHELSVQVFEPGAQPRGCHLVYVDGRDAGRSARLVAMVEAMPVLSVGDAAQFAELGGIAQLILERDRMRFAINVTAAERARIRLSSKLLSLATIVRN